MAKPHGDGRFIFWLVANAAAIIGVSVLINRLGNVAPENKKVAAEPSEALAVIPSVKSWALPDFSPALLHLLVRETPKPKPRSGQGPSPSMFFVLLPSVCMSLLPAPSHAQTANSTIALPPLHVDALSTSCVDVQVEGIRQPAFDCLNEQLKATAQSATPSDPNSALDAVVGNAEPNKFGTFSHTGESIRMGSNFGKSAFPQRPPAPVYSNALTAGVK